MKHSIAALLLCLIFSNAAKALPVDVTVLFDSSGSMSIDEYLTLKDYTQELIGDIRDANADTTFAVVEFSTNEQILSFHQQDLAAVNAAIDASHQQLGQTDWTDALDAAGLVISNSGRVAAQQVVILITDGVHNVGSILAAYDSANDLLDEGALLFGVGFGDLIAIDDLEDIVSSPSDEFAFQVDGADQLVDTIPDIVAKLNALEPPTGVPAPAGLLFVLLGCMLLSVRNSLSGMR